MIFRIKHSLRYTYSEPVWLEALVVRLCPLSNPFQQVDRFHLEVSPQPSASSPLLDVAGNSALRLTFEGPHRSLKLNAYTEARTLRDNPFDFLLEPGCAALPFSYSDAATPLLQAYLNRHPAAPVADLARQARNAAQGETVRFLILLAELIHQRIRVKYRPRGDPYPPTKTLRVGEGACRDLAILYVEACRAMGLAARFVSGYRHQPQLPAPELHAWCEAYLPGGGWRGFDPSAGLAVDSSYLALAVGPTHHEARPVQGSFRGDARSRLRTSIELQAV